MRFPSGVTRAGATACIVFLATACAGPAFTPTATSPPLPAPSPTSQSVVPHAVNLPADEGIHLAPLAWWYFNGHLTDSTGHRYSFHFVNFITVTSDGQIPQLMQLSLADHDEGIYLTDEKPALVNNLQPTQGSFSFDMADWHMSGAAGIFPSAYELVFSIGDYALDLAATSQRSAILHQGSGLVDMGKAGKTFYYSRTKLEISGELTRNGVPTPVAGRAWMDHQWGDFSTQPVGWDWASLQLDDGSDLMISLVWDSSTGQPIISYGTYVPARVDANSSEMAGLLRHLSGGDISLTPTNSWRSPASGVEYPSGWLLEISSLDLEITLFPVQQNAEFGDSLYVPIAYWEGAVAVTGVKEGQKIAGNGFVELVGYDKARPTRQAP